MKTWVQEKKDELIAKRKRGEVWDQDDCEAWAYCENVLAESRWRDDQEQKYDDEITYFDRATI